MVRIIRSALISSLDQYMTKPEPVPPPRPRQDPKAQLNFRPSIPQELAESYFVGAGYDGERRAVYLKLYEPKSQKIHFWYDNTGHSPYCLSKESQEIPGKQTSDTPRTTSTIADSSPECPTPSNAATSYRFNQ